MDLKHYTNITNRTQIKLITLTHNKCAMTTDQMVTNRVVYVEFPNKKGIERRYRGCPAPVLCIGDIFSIDSRRLSGATARYVKKYIKIADQENERKRTEGFREMFERGDTWGYDPAASF